MPDKVRKTAWKPDFSKDSPFEGMPSYYPAREIAGFKRTKTRIAPPSIAFYRRTPELRAMGREVYRSAGVRIPFSLLEKVRLEEKKPPSSGSQSSAPVTSSRAPNIPSSVKTIRRMSTGKRR